MRASQGEQVFEGMYEAYEDYLHAADLFGRGIPYVAAT